MSKFTTVGTVYDAIVKVLHDEDKRSFIEGRSEKELRNFISHANECMFKAENTAMPPDMLALFIETTNELISLVTFQLENMSMMPDLDAAEEKVMAKYKPRKKTVTQQRAPDTLRKFAFEWLKTNEPEVVRKALEYAKGALKANNDSPDTKIQKVGMDGTPHATSEKTAKLRENETKIGAILEPKTVI